MKPVFIDVRSDNEWRSGHVPNAMHLPLEDIMSGQDPELDKSAPIYLYCRSGNRSGIAEHLLKSRGYKNLKNAGSLEQAQALSLSL